MIEVYENGPRRVSWSFLLGVRSFELEKSRRRGRLRRAAAACARPFRTAWPDQGRHIAQGAVLSRLLGRAADSRLGLGNVVNAGAGEGLYSGFLLVLPGLNRLVEIDISYATRVLPTTDGRQLVVAASLTAVPLPSDWADLVLCSEVLEHIPDDGAAIRELRRIVAPSGWLLITVPTPPAPYDPNHVREGYDPAQMALMLEKSGLVVVETAFAMHGMFKLMMRWWRAVGWIPKPVLPAWCKLDRLFRFGRPMDMLVLCRVPQ